MPPRDRWSVVRPSSATRASAGDLTPGSKHTRRPLVAAVLAAPAGCTPAGPGRTA